MVTSSSELLNPKLPEKLDRVRIPVVEATDESLKGFGCLVEKQEDQEIEIVRWPHQGWREVDPDTGNEGGTTEGIFEGEWKGDVLYGSNQAVSGNILPHSGIDPSTVKRMNLSHTGRVRIQDFSLNIQNHDKLLHRLKQSFG